MLAEIRIQRFAVIEDLSVRFEAGLNIITGETGAGKSILIDALSLLLGARASSEMVRTGHAQAEIEGRFEPPFDPRLGKSLAEMGIEWEGDSLVIRRVVSAEGKSRAYLQGTLATVGQLAALSPCLVDICGQHEYQTLMDPERQLGILDLVGGLDAERDGVAALHAALRGMESELRRLTQLETQRAERESYLRFQWKDLKDIDLSVEEEQSLLADRKRLAHVERLSAGADAAVGELTQERGALSTRLDGIARNLRELASLDAALGPAADLVDQARIQVDEASYALMHYRNGLPSDSGALDRVEERLALYKTLKKKYGPEVSDVLARRSAVEKDLSQLDDFEFHRARAEKEVRKAEAAYLEAARALRQRRVEAARSLEKDVVRQLGDLAMKSTRFQAAFVPEPESPSEWLASGLDRIEFMLSPNVGEDPKPLSKIASGGELSRILLALRRTLAEGHPAPKTYVFDEVDAGIGGEVAEVVGRKMAEIASADQVLCVTHLPQMAVWATHHYRVSKEVEGDRTRTRAVRLDAAGREQEVARMLAGTQITEKTLAHARELLSIRNSLRKAV